MARVDYFHDPNAPKANSLRPAVSAFVQDGTGRLLMIRRTDNDKYAIPGGQQEVGETLAQAATREVREETGIQVEITDLIGLYSNPAHVIAYDDGEVRQEFSICFRAVPVGGSLSTSSESKEVCWVELTELPRLDVHPSIRLRIGHGLDRRPRPYFA
ncbi:NUDIX domain-containing protein [Lentzea sp. NBC_00516]|uniref:NUDIX hydrolase n=1 Tax=Lentzea sp. NBC_00516 TaxID=2903582 RepID=UPI002E81CA8F|nr:NUDIX domain-containing protein [Lentzea sp. NBC_00516]WUD23164.1 NUDIX domain-containing protein [Lentzea sp. NBC_00516]